MTALPPRETLRIEFKSDRAPLPDRDLLEAIVCLANTEGGHLYLGVEDDGRVTGIHKRRRDVTMLAAMIANRTTPPVSVRIITEAVAGATVAVIAVPRYERIVATTDGVVKRRRLKLDGTPECVPFLPHEFASRASDLRQLDYSTLPVAGATLGDLDPLQRSRLRALIQRYRGDAALADLDDESLDGALGLTAHEAGERRPTVLGLLFLGKEAALRRHMPTHEVAFQVLDGEEVRVNDIWRLPLLEVFERIAERFEARVEEEEIEFGLFRVPVPQIDRRAFREAVANALTHRDYTKLGPIQIRWEADAITISNPGGFVEGVTLDNLLSVEPHPRNPALADGFKRIGLVERTGRGVDLMYRGLLRYGRPAPDFGRSTATRVVVHLSTGAPQLTFLEMLLRAEREQGKELPIDVLIALSILHEERRVDTPRIAHAIQKDDVAARRALEALVEAGLVEAHGIKRGRTYTLSAEVYRTLGQPQEYVRQAGFDPIQREQMILHYVRAHGEIRRRDVIGLCHLSPTQASRLLRKMVDQGELIPHGKGPARTYSSTQKRSH